MHNFSERSTCLRWFFLDVQSVWVVPTCEDNCDGVVVYPKQFRVRLPLEDTLQLVFVYVVGFVC